MKEEKQIQRCYIGIDVSKLTVDVCIVNANGLNSYLQFENNLSGFKKMETWLNGTGCFSFDQSLFCMEHTGVYTRELVCYLVGKGSLVWMESALQLKRSMGMTRGKSDKVDAYRIARYAMTNEDKARLVKMSNTTIQQMKDLMSNRERLAKSYQSLNVSINEIERIDKKMGKDLRKLNNRALNGILASKKNIEAKMHELIYNDEELKRMFELVTSIKGVGTVLATELLVYTEGFSRMANARQLACYCGVAPFEHSSGTSVRGRIGTSNFANMNLKSTLHLAALSSTRYVPELRTYYERKVAEGKSKMSVINAVRNKLIQRIVAVIKRGTPYVENFAEINLENS
jgi:transposase